MARRKQWGLRFHRFNAAMRQLAWVKWSLPEEEIPG
jgi:hypothetical protein